MFKTTLKGLFAHKLRLALTGLAIVMGVAFVSGTFVLTDTLTGFFDEAFAESTAGTDFVVSPATSAATVDNFTPGTERIPAGVLE
jgi:putative ABC transport system permease protein